MAKQKISAPVWRNRIVGSGEERPQDLQDNPHNWRRHTAKQTEALAGVLAEVGWVQQVVLNKQTGRLIDGHLRVALALSRREAVVPVLYVDLSPEEETLILATLDPIAALAEVDTDKLSALLEQVSTGEVALQQMLSTLAEESGILPPTPAAPEEPAAPEPDRYEALVAKWRVEEGQLWQLGRHRVLCADALQPESWERVLGGTPPALIFADPPYGVSIVQTNGFVGGGEAYDIPFGGRKGKRRQGGTHEPTSPPVGKYPPVLGDENTDTAVQAVTSLLAAYPEVMHVWWGANYYVQALTPSQCWLVWDKQTTGHFADCELAWTNQDRAARLFRHRWNGMLRASERERRWHPTQKPAALAAWVFGLFGREGDVVLDPFLGGGCSVLGGEQTGRAVHGIERLPEYVAVTVERWHGATGQEPVRL